MVQLISLNVNQLSTIISEYFSADTCCVESVDVGAINDQHNTKTIDLGPGAVLTLTLSLEGDLKERGNCNGIKNT